MVDLTKFYNMETSHISLGIIVTLTIIILSSWFTRSSKPKVTAKGSLPPEVSSWIPVFGSLPQYIFSPISYMQARKSEFPQGLYTFTAGSHERTVVYGKEYLKQINELPKASKDLMSSQVNLVSRGFGQSFSLSASFDELLPSIQDELEKVLNSLMSKLTDDAVRELEQRMPSLMSFLDSPIDHEPWERMSGTLLLEDGETMETGLIALVQSFLTFFTTEQLLAPSLFEQTPDIVPLTISLISNLENLLLKPVMIAPHPQAVLRHLLPKLRPFLNSVISMSEEEPMDYISMELLESPDTAFLQILRLKAVQSATLEVQASLLAYLIGVSVIPHTLVPWTILQILAPKSTLSNQREDFDNEIANSVSVFQEEGIHLVLPPVTVKVDQSGLRSCRHMVVDTIDLYGRGWDEIKLKQDAVLPSTDTENPTYCLPEGSNIIAAYWLRDSDSKPKEKEFPTVEAALKDLGLFHLSPLAPYLAKLYPAFISIFLKLYEIEPVKKWAVPDARFSPGVALPVSDVRVRIKKKKIA